VKENVAASSIPGLWQQEIEQHRSECRFNKGKWYLPSDEGFESRNRTRVTQEAQLMRAADIYDAQQMTQLWQSGLQMLDRFKASIQPIAVAAVCDRQEPIVNAVASDMPVHTRPSDFVCAAIHREVWPTFLFMFLNVE